MLWKFLKNRSFQTGVAIQATFEINRSRRVVIMAFNSMPTNDDGQMDGVPDTDKWVDRQKG